jgi:hypothetical protein
MSDSTDINALPSDINPTFPQLSGQPNSSANANANGNISLDPDTISQIVSGIQQASLTGATMLPSRDIPSDTTQFNNDPQTLPNYVPPPPQNTVQRDYIRDNEMAVNDMINNYNRKNEFNNNLDDAYNELQTPLLITILYFLFQLPFLKRFLFANMPFLFSNDGNHNLNGFLFTSVLFGVAYHSLTKLMGFFSVF